MELLLLPKFSTVFGEQLGVMKTVPWSWVSKVFIDRDTPSVFTVKWNHQCSTFLPSLIAFVAENNAWLLGQRAANGLLGLNQQTLLRVYTPPLRGWQTDPRNNELQARDSGCMWMFNSDLHSGNEKEAEKCQEHTKHLLSMHFLLQLFRYSFNQAVIAVEKLTQGHLSTIMQTLITLTPKSTTWYWNKTSKLKICFPKEIFQLQHHIISARRSYVEMQVSTELRSVSPWIVWIPIFRHFIKLAFTLAGVPLGMVNLLPIKEVL